MKKILIISFFFLSFNVFGETIQDWNPWVLVEKDFGNKIIIVKSSDIGSPKIYKIIEGIKNDYKKCIIWFDGTKFCMFK